MEAEPISEQKLEWMELNLEWASRSREPRFVGKTVLPLAVSGRPDKLNNFRREVARNQ